MKREGVILPAATVLVGGLLAGSLVVAQEKPEATEVWKPAPAIVVPAKAAGGAPSDAVVLFDGDDLDQWVSTKDKSPARWQVANGVITVDKTRGNIETKRAFGDYQLHLEWRIPADIAGKGQARSATIVTGRTRAAKFVPQRSEKRDG